jgi:hypothetical protein
MFQVLRCFVPPIQSCHFSIQTSVPSSRFVVLVPHAVSVTPPIATTTFLVSTSLCHYCCHHNTRKLTMSNTLSQLPTFFRWTRSQTAASVKASSLEAPSTHALSSATEAPSTHASTPSKTVVPSKSTHAETAPEVTVAPFKSTHAETAPEAPRHTSSLLQSTPTTARLYHWDPTHKKWGSPSDLSIPPVPHEQRISPLTMAGPSCPKPSLVLPLERGGQLVVWRQLLDSEMLARLKTEMMQVVQFRRYKVQGTWEPRVHSLYHQHATADDTQPQPGYRYGTITLKARPLDELDVLSSLTPVLERHSRAVTSDSSPSSQDTVGTSVHKEEEDVESECPPLYWNIGVNPVIYRSGRDRMGMHADDDQGEEIIMTTIVDGPVDNPRPLVIQPTVCKKGRAQKDLLNAMDEKIELFLCPGDVYHMDGKMQVKYVHSVPPSLGKYTKGSEASDGQDRRMIVVCRRGKFCRFKRDSGEPVPAPLSVPIKKSYRIGAMDGLAVERVYSRNELIEMGAHLGIQRSISGSMKFGCDAIIISGTRDDDYEWDSFFELVYAVEHRKGGGALQGSFERGLQVRVFRTSKVDASILLQNCTSQTSQCYRYDGLYDIAAMQAPQNRDDPLLFFLRMSNPTVNGTNPDDHPSTQRPLSSCAHTISFNRPSYLDGLSTRRLTRSRFLRLLSLDLSGEGTRLKSLREMALGSKASSNDVLCYFQEAMEMLMLRLHSLEKEEEERAHKMMLADKVLEAQEQAERKRKRLARPSSPKEPRRPRRPKLECSCRQFRCDICHNCSKPTCPKNPCRCPGGAIRRGKYKPKPRGKQNMPIKQASVVK